MADKADSVNQAVPAAERVRAIFDREVLKMEANMKPSPMVEWLERLRDEVLSVLLNNGGFDEGYRQGLIDGRYQ